MADTLQDKQGNNYSWLDSDTIADNERSYRIKGYNARETSKVITDEDGKLRFIQGQLGGDEQTKTTKNIAEIGGFNNIKHTGEYDVYGRELIELVNDRGETLSNTLYEAGVVDVNEYTDEEGIKAAQYGAMRREAKDTNQYTDTVNDNITRKPIYYKDTAQMEEAFGPAPVNEAEYAQQVIGVIAQQQGLDLNNEADLRKATQILDNARYDPRSLPFEAISFRNPEATKEGLAKGQISASWNQGWKGMALGLMGSSELFGVLIGSDEMRKWGGVGVEIAKEELKEEPRLRSMDYRDIDSLWDGFEYFTNTIAMSAPYLTTLAAGTLLAAPTFGLSAYTAYATVGGSYAGQVWNDIDGPKGRKEAAFSLAAGVAMAVVDMLGFKGLISPSTILSKEGRNQLIKEYAKRQNITEAASEKIVREASQKQIKYMMEGLGNFAYDLARKGKLAPLMAKTAYGKAAVGGALKEGSTEAIQEGIGYLSSTALSEGEWADKFDEARFKNLLAQSFVAGSSLGAGFSTAGELFHQGNRQVIKGDLAAGRLNRLNDYQQIAAEFKPTYADGSSTAPNENGVEVAYGNPQIIEANKRASSIINNNSINAEGINKINVQRAENGQRSDIELENGIAFAKDEIANLEIKEAENQKTLTSRDSSTEEKRVAQESSMRIAETRKDKQLIISKLQKEVDDRAAGFVTQLTKEDKKRLDKEIADYRVRNKDQDYIAPGSKVLEVLSKKKEREAADKDYTLWGKLKNFKKYTPKSYRAATTAFLRPELLRVSETLRKIASLLGTPLGAIFSGRNVSAFEASLFGSFMLLLKPKQIFQRFKMWDTLTASDEISQLIREYMAAKVDPTSQKSKDYFNGENYSKYGLAIETTVRDLNLTMQKIFDEEYKMMVLEVGKGAAVRRVNDPADPSWFNNGAFDWKKVRNDEAGWKSFMANHGRKTNGEKYTYTEINDLYNKISNQEEAVDFSLIEGNFWQPNSFKGLDNKALSEEPGFAKYANTNVVFNMTHLSRQYAKYIAYTTYFGAGGKDLDYMIGQLEGELEPEDIQDVVQGIKDVIDAGTGNFNPIKSRFLSYWQRKASFLATIIGLPISVISSFVEFGMILWNDPGFDVIKKGLGQAVDEMTSIFEEIQKKPVHPTLQNIPFEKPDSKAVYRLTKAGHFHDDAVAATRVGMGETDIAQAWWLKKFFKWSLISPLTLFQRIGASAQVGAFVSDRLRILAAIPNGYEMNQRQLEVYTQLRDLGMDVDTMVRLFIKYGENSDYFDSLFQDDAGAMVDADKKFIDDQMDLVTYNFVDERVQNPGSFNRPLIFQDPHYQLLFQFNGYISTFTSTIIPKMWIDYSKNGSPRMKYNTFALMVLMFALAGVSQWLKDYIKFGKTTPYLNGAQQIQRALMAAGLLGTGERVLQAAFPLYKSRDESVIDRLFGETLGGAPMVRNVAEAGKAVGHVLSGDNERALKSGLKITPGVSVLTPIRNIITDAIYRPNDIRPYK